jgi:hypothetical protein
MKSMTDGVTLNSSIQTPAYRSETKIVQLANDIDYDLQFELLISQE